MADYVATTEDFKAVANAIRTKGGTSAPLAFPDEFASAIQAIAGPKPEQEKEITISENGDVTITADVGKVLSKVLAHVNVSGGGGGADISPLMDVRVSTWIPANNYTPYVITPEMQEGLIGGMIFRKEAKLAKRDTATTVVIPAWGSNDLFTGGVSKEVLSSYIPTGDNYPPAWHNTSSLVSFDVGYEAEIINKPYQAGAEYIVVLLYGPLGGGVGK